jgi:hypothetical protein
MLLAAFLLTGGTAFLLTGGTACRQQPETTAPALAEEPADLPAQVHAFCGSCHPYPPADTFPRAAWKDEVERGFLFAQQLAPPYTGRRPLAEHVIRYYEKQAPERLPPAAIERATTPVPVRFEQIGIPPAPGTKDRPAISNVNLVHLFDEHRLDVLACEMGSSKLLLLKPYEEKPTWKVLAELPHPAHAEVVDLDGDGIKDILVACLGSFEPTDALKGSVEWLRGNGDGTFTRHTLLRGVGRVADVQAAKFMGTDKLDLVVGCFGWNFTGEIYLLENQTTDWTKPKFEPHVLDSRHGTIHVPVADLNNDGKPDFVALISQEHETVVAFLNQGNGKFRKETIYAGPHPAYGSSGIQLVDLDGDGKLDVLYTNGDVLDQPFLLKPYHSVQWLQNPGDGTFPWKHHPITPMYGVHRAVAADLRGNGVKDIVAVSYLPAAHFPQRQEMNLDAVILLEQVAPGKFVRHTLQTRACDSVSCALGDLYGRGKIDLVTGTFTTSGKPEHALTIWKNLGK